MDADAGGRLSYRGALATAMGCLLAGHALLIVLLQPHAITASRCATVALGLIATACVWLRSERVARREQAMLRWLSAGMFLWIAAHFVETLLGPPIAASSLAVDPSDMIYVISGFPLLLALSTTKETEPHRSIFLLNCAQIGLATVLTYVLLFMKPMTPAEASTAMSGIYAAECGLLVALTAFRFLAWTSKEERRVIGAILIFLASYLPIEIGMDYASLHWRLKGGSLLDLLWSVPFCLSAGLTLYLPLDKEGDVSVVEQGRNRMLVGTMSPLLITTGVFALAASVTVAFPVLALTSIFLLLVAQGVESGVLQRRYMLGQSLLIERELDLRKANGALERLSQIDPLTNIANRRRFDLALDQAGRRAVREKRPISLLIVDLDYFKGINDVHGHSYGDVCLVSMARMLGQQAKRPYDLLARYGGDEFLLLLPDTGADGATAIADRIHAAVAELGLENQASPMGERLTVSIGVGVSDAEFKIGGAALVDLADRALYEAKRRGRNQSCLQTPPGGPELVGGTGNVAY
jgi:diguanylate cyclase (GGDEF)-like protein